MNITFLRHAESTFNHDKTSGPDCSLTVKGIAHARALKGHWDLVILSPLKRARQTLENSAITYDRLEIWPCTREQRVDPCDFLDGEELTRESDECMITRGDEFLEKISKVKERNVLVVSHCEFITSITGTALHNACSIVLNLKRYKV